MKYRRFQSLDDVPPRLRERVLLWLITPFPTFFALVFVRDLSDGTTRTIRGHEATIWAEPVTFSLATLLCALFCLLAAFFWLALINNWNSNWLPPHLRDKPHLAVAFLFFATAMAFLFGLELLSGEITIRSHKLARLLGDEVTSKDTPGSFAVFGTGLLAVCVAVGVGWFLVCKRWVNPPEDRWKPTFANPAKRARFK